MTKIDEIIEEIRRSRLRMSREAGHDVARYIQHLKPFNETYRDQVSAYRRSHPVSPASTSP